MKTKLGFVLCIFMLLMFVGCDYASDATQDNTNALNSINQTETTIVTEPPDTSSSNPSETADVRQDETLPVLESPMDSGTLNMQEQNGDIDNAMIDITITANGSVFSATLYSIETTRTLIEMFPMTLDMSDLHRNEKYYYLSENLPTNSARVGSIRTGDIMLYGANCVVLFYEDFSTSYSYTRLGFIDDASGLADALGQCNVQVAFAVSE